MSATGVSVDLGRELRAICGNDFVAEAAASVQNSAPSFNVAPGSADEIAGILRLANERAFTIAPVGGGSELLASPGSVYVLLHTDRLNQIEHYDAADLTVGIGAGMNIVQLSAMVAADKLMFGCDPSLPERATVGGILATAAQGPLRHGYGALRDFCIGMRFVTGDGRKAKGGGRVVKNVAGYDMMKLLVGSYGTLAVITSASFKLFPAPRQTRTFLAEFSTWQEALKFRDLVLHSPLSPMCLEIVSPAARKLMRPEMTEDAWVICVRGAGSDAVLGRYRKELGSAVTREVEGKGEAELWRVLEDFPPPRDNQQPVHVTIDIPLGEVGNVLQSLQTLLDGNGMSLIGRAGIGHLVLRLEDGPSLEKIVGAFAQAGRRDCSIAVHGAGKVCRLTPSDTSAMRAVKQALDPNNVLRGRELF